MRWGLEKGLKSKGQDEEGGWEGGHAEERASGRGDEGWPGSESPRALAFIDFYFADILFYYQVSD